jgi:hypothetical protein
MNRASIQGFAGAVMIAATAAVGIAAVCVTEVVTESEVVRQAENTPPLGNWVLYTRTLASGAQFAIGPETPPSGVGSLALQTPGTGDKVTLFNFDHIGTALSEITAIGYSTYRDPASITGSPFQVPAINMQVDFNGLDTAGGFTTLVFEPVYNTGQGAVVDGEWQTWDAYNGNWWSTRAIPGVCAFDCFVAWNDIVAANPDAVIVGGFGINQGSGNGGLIAAADALKLAYGDDCVTYDFEPFRVPGSAEACKNGGWRTTRRADGSPFKNQGDCIQYVNTGQ